MRRYSKTNIVGSWYGTSEYVSLIQNAIESGRLQFQERLSTHADRLDTLANLFYGDGRLWWVIAAASGIGWAPQMPAGTLLRVPIDINAVAALIG
jgi:hypothetical protein